MSYVPVTAEQLGKAGGNDRSSFIQPRESTSAYWRTEAVAIFTETPTLREICPFFFCLVHPNIVLLQRLWANILYWALCKCEDKMSMGIGAYGLVRALGVYLLPCPHNYLADFWK